jgi:hypothetical protein
MKKRMLLIFAALVLVCVLLTQPVSADQGPSLFAYNYQTNCYGAKADIYTPSTALSLSDQSAESSWVQADGINGNWVSTGWMFQNYWSNAVPFTEFGINGVSDQLQWGTQTWGSSNNYKVTGSGSWWYLYINNILEYEGLTFISAPASHIVVSSEVINSTTDVLNSCFLNVSWLNNLGYWNLFSQNNFYSDLPYHVVHSVDYCFVTNGPY